MPKIIEPCKCCGQPSSLFCVVDFTRNAGFKFPLNGIPVYYHRCQGCGFLFTTALDKFTEEDFSKYVYNAEYALVDSHYLGARPTGNAVFIKNLFTGLKPDRILDYGCGAGLLVEKLNADLAPTDGFDPFVPQFSKAPCAEYDLVTSFEVAEHSTTPVDVIADMAQYLKTPGILIFTTLVQPPDIIKQGANWWYIGPRAGHVSLHSYQSLRVIADKLQIKLFSKTDNTHFMYREVPDFAKHLIPGVK